MRKYLALLLLAASCSESSPEMVARATSHCATKAELVESGRQMVMSTCMRRYGLFRKCSDRRGLRSPGCYSNQPNSDLHIEALTATARATITFLATAISSSTLRSSRSQSRPLNGEASSLELALPPRDDGKVRPAEPLALAVVSGIAGRTE